MVSFAHKLRKFLPKVPRRRYGIFTGTNTIGEWFLVLKAVFFKAAHDDVEIIKAYERAFASACDATQGISFGAGRMALYAILEALDIGCDDEVIIPAFTCVVVPNAILYRGARPIYVDIEASTFNIDADAIEAAITPKTKALYAQHTFGVVCNIDKIKEIAARHNLPVIEDCAHALGAMHQGRPVGSLTEIAFFSTDHSKVINTHLGGMAVTNRHDLAAKLKVIQDEASFLDKKKNKKILRTFLMEYILFSPCCLWFGGLVHAILVQLGFLFNFRDELEVKKPNAYPYPCRLSSVQAQLGLCQLKKLEDNIQYRRDIAQWLESKIGWYGSRADINNSTWLRYSFLVDDRKVFEKKFNKYFDLGIWFTSVVSGRMNALEEVGYLQGSCPVAEFVVQHIVNFPTHKRISFKQLKKVVSEYGEGAMSKKRYEEFDLNH